MKIGTKLVVLQLVLIAFLSAGVLATVIFLVLPSVERIERDAALTDFKRIKHAIKQEEERLLIQARDWGVWDDTYEYIFSRDKEYEVSNLSSGTITELQMDLLVIFDLNGDVVKQTFADNLDREQVFSVVSLLGNTESSGGVSTRAKVLELGSALVMTPAGMMAIAASPVLPSDQQGIARGSIFFGRFIDEDFAHDVSVLTQTPVSLSVSHKHNLPTESVVFLSDSEVLVSGAVPLINDEQVSLLISIEQSRPYYNQALSAARYAVISIIVAGIIICWFIFFILKRILVFPILTLQRQADLFGSTNQVNVFKPLKQEDEIGQLSKSFTTMAKKLTDNWLMLARERNDYMVASNTDPLTHLRNRRFLEQVLDKDTTWAVEKNWLFLMLDLDHFKNINDRYGHDFGDLILQQLADLLENLSRSSDIVIRYGGEEFALISPETNESIGCSIAERIRQRVEQYAFGTQENTVSLTCSIGFFSLKVGATNEQIPHWRPMLKVADLALYAAKDSGRNTWVGLQCNTSCPQEGLPTKPEEIAENLKGEKLSIFSGSSIHPIKWS